MTTTLVASIIVCLFAFAFLLVVFTVGATAAGISAFGRITYWRGKAESAAISQADAVNRLQICEAGRARIDRDFEHLRAAVADLAKRPVIAALDDEQAQGLVQTIAELVHRMNPVAPNRMN
jgi:hypothetical protein